jgi:hypothetical protein
VGIGKQQSFATLAGKLEPEQRRSLMIFGDTTGALDVTQTSIRFLWENFTGRFGALNALSTLTLEH